MKNNVRSDIIAFWVVLCGSFLFGIGYCIGKYFYDNNDTMKAI